MFKFSPILKNTIWGGTKIAPFKNIHTQLRKIGESWEVSGVPGNETVVSEGPYAGRKLNDLVAELKELENVELPAVRDAIAEARDKGDLSENFEYHAAKREQSRLLGRIRFMQKVLENARVIDKSKLGGDSVGLLSKVEMTNLANNARMTYTIVSPHEANLREGKISIKSPIAQALLNKKAGDTVEVRVPAGLMKLRIESIEL